MDKNESTANSTMELPAPTSKTKEQPPPEAPGSGKRERLADYAHETWCGWMEYMFEESTKDETSGSVKIPFGLVERWTRQMNTKYKDLPEKEKKSDRKEADRMMEIMANPNGKGG